MEPTTRQLWLRYVRKREPEIKQQLLEEYTSLVKYAVDRFAMVLPRSVDSNDLLSAAIIGLFEAIDAYDPQRGVKFESYAMPRIRGAVLDQLRTMDWVPRSLRRKARMVENTMSQLEGILGRPPTDEEVADYLDIDLDTYRKMLLDVNAVSFVSLDDPISHDSGQGVTLKDLIQDPVAEEPGMGLEEEDTRDQLARAIEQLPERKRLVIALYYYEGLTLKEIGQVLGVTESRVCQIHTESILYLRSTLNRAMQFEVVGMLR